MPEKLNSQIVLETAFNEYTLDTVLGEGGAGRVYGGVSQDGQQVAVKILTQTSSDKRRRFKNEIAFLARAKHPNIVTVTDHGLATGKLAGPFYVMPRYDRSLRLLLDAGIPSGDVLQLFSQVMDGVEAAHLLGATHRDLKPENILSGSQAPLAIADFGVASFTSDQLVTLVETGPGQRLANFQYAAPEQRKAGGVVTSAADIYALGLILNEMFTGHVPHGTSFKQISDVSKDHAYLDKVVAAMIAQSPADRPGSLQQVKAIIRKYSDESINLQRISELNNVVIPVGSIDDPLAYNPPKIVGASWQPQTLTLILDQIVSPGWAETLKYKLGSYSSALGYGPDRFNFKDNTATIGVPEHAVQSVIDYFKTWLPQATNVYRHELEEAARQQEIRLRQQLRAEREAEELRLRVNQNLKF